MSHLDEGMIHELLDGELPPDEARAARSHLVTCAECRAIYEEAKAFLDESNRLVTTLDADSGVTARLPARPPATDRESFRARPSRGLPLRTMAWAASIFLAISLGYYGSDFRNHAAGKLKEEATPALTPALLPEQAPVVEEPSAPPAAAVARKTNQERQKPASPAASPQRLDEVGQAAARDSTALFRAENEAGAAGGRVAGQSVASAELRSAAVTDQAADAKDAAEQPAAAPMNMAAKVAAPTVQPAFRRVPMEEGVRILGGTIRLIDGLTPERVETGSGQLVAGARPGLSVVRVIYLDPPRREIWLDQQHGAGAAAAAADTILVPSSSGAESLQWHPAPGEWLSLTGFLTADSLHALARRVK